MKWPLCMTLFCVNGGVGCRFKPFWLSVAGDTFAAAAAVVAVAAFIAFFVAILSR